MRKNIIASPCILHQYNTIILISSHSLYYLTPIDAIECDPVIVMVIRTSGFPSTYVQHLPRRHHKK